MAHAAAADVQCLGLGLLISEDYWNSTNLVSCGAAQSWLVYGTHAPRTPSKPFACPYGVNDAYRHCMARNVFVGHCHHHLVVNALDPPARCWLLRWLGVVLLSCSRARFPHLSLTTKLHIPSLFSLSSDYGPYNKFASCVLSPQLASNNADCNATSAISIAARHSQYSSVVHGGYHVTQQTPTRRR